MANSGYVGDIELLNQLAIDKLSAAAVDVGTEGWSWVDTRVQRDNTEMARYRHLLPERREFTRKEKTEYRALKKASDAAAQALNAYYDSDDEQDDDVNSEQLEEAAALAEQATDDYEARLESWTDEQKARAGVIVTLDYAGALKIERGLVRPQERGGGKGCGLEGRGSVPTREGQAAACRDTVRAPDGTPDGGRAS